MTKPTVDGNKIAYFREKRGLTQSKLAKKINREYGKNIRQATISSWENGTTPSVDNLEALAKALGVEPEDLYEKSILDEEIGLYKTEIKAYELALDEADAKFKEDQVAGYNMLREKFTELKDQTLQISNNNTRMIEIFSKISELLPPL
ncbi:MAG: helix-turn-helix domain-containing protein [Cytophagales bacterium]|nr:helix-turn-helix domain-containing protein [Cytophagales bacterium]